MLKIFIILIGMASPAWAAQLAPNPTLEREEILLGDIFHDIGDKAEAVVGRAPAAGQSITLNVEQLQALARRHQLNWRPAHVLQNLTITRASQLIDMTEIQVAVELALQEQFPQSLLTVMLDRSVAPIHLPLEATPSLSIHNFSHDANSMRFNARVVAAEGTPHEARQNVTGRFTRMVEIPVAVTRLPQGHLISQQDLTWLAIPENNVNRGIAENITQLVGMEVRRALSENAPIRTSDVMEPELIRKGDMVVMEVVTPYMSLTAQGRALDTGRLHGMVRVQNLTSRQIVQGIVVERGRVQVSVPFLRPLQQTALPSNPSIRSR